MVEFVVVLMDAMVMVWKVRVTVWLIVVEVYDVDSKLCPLKVDGQCSRVRDHTMASKDLCGRKICISKWVVVQVCKIHSEEPQKLEMVLPISVSV